MIQCRWRWKPGKMKPIKTNGTTEKNTMQNLKHMQNQLDLFEQPIQQNETLYFVTWEEVNLNRKSLDWLTTTKTKTTCRPMQRDEMYEFIEFLKSTFIYCGWYHITKAN